MIHPIAGKCKHCKGDVAGVRTTRPAAVAALPAIIATHKTPLNPPIPNGHANGHTNGHANGHANGHTGNGSAAYAPMPPAAAQIAVRALTYEANPVLPPRPTGRIGTAQPSRASWWKSWPLIVIVLAVLAIVTAIVLMVWPPGKAASADPGMETTKGGKLIPAPERMETNPLPPKKQPPPKSGDNTRPPPRIDIPDDPGAGLPGGLGGGPSGKSTLSGRNAVMMEIPLRLCERAVKCGQIDDTLQVTCAATKLSLQSFNLSPPNCAARTRCLGHIDQLDCDDFSFSTNSATKLMTGVQACIEAVNGC